MIVYKRQVHCQAKEDNKWQKAALSMLTKELKQIAEFSEHPRFIRIYKRQNVPL